MNGKLLGLLSGLTSHHSCSQTQGNEKEADPARRLNLIFTVDGVLWRRKAFSPSIGKGGKNGEACPSPFYLHLEIDLRCSH